MSNLRLQTKVGKRLVSTIRIEDHPWEYETIVFSGRNRSRTAHMDTYRSEEEARKGHEVIVTDVKENPSNYDLRLKKWYERLSIISPN